MTSVAQQQIEMINPADLKIDARTQRRRDDSHVDRIAARWDQTLVGLLQVSRRPDGYYILDGQHRAAAAIKAGHGGTPLPCLVVEGLSIAEEGHRFVGINSTTKKPTTIELFRIRVVAQDPAAVEIDRILADAGLRLGITGADGSISAIGAVEEVYFGRRPARRQPFPELLIDTLSILQRSWGVTRDAYDAVLIKAMGSLLIRYSDRVDKARLCHLLAKSGSPAQLIGRAKTLGDATRKSAPVAAVDVIIDIYNHGLRTGRLAPKAEAVAE